MFKKPTVFVLGAGASCHYGYPTGEGLVAKVMECTRAFRAYCQNRKSATFNHDQLPRFMDPLGKERPAATAAKAWDHYTELCDDLLGRLQAVEPIVIDYFLGWNEHLSDLGRIMIGGALLECEARGAGVPLKPDDDGKHNWIRFVIHQLLKDCRTSADLLKSDVHFITFNYDRSFEKNLQLALAAVGFLKGEDIYTFFAKPRVVHMYGALTANTFVTRKSYQSLTANFNTSGLEAMEEATRLLELWDSATRNLRVIDPHTKHDDEVAAEAKKLLARAERIYFLGYAFDPENNRRLGLRDLYQVKVRRQFAMTNLYNSGTVNLHAGSALSFPGTRTEPGPFFVNSNHTLQRSERRCYDAIALDFGMLSE